MTIPPTREGNRDLEVWATTLGSVKAFGIEGTGSYGAGLSRDLLAKGHRVVDVMRPDRQLRYLHGKSDFLEGTSINSLLPDLWELKTLISFISDDHGQN